MNNIYKDRLASVADDDLLIRVLRALFDERLAMEMPEENCPNNELGERYRAYMDAKRIIGKAFSDLNNYKVGKKSTPSPNRAR